VADFLLHHVGESLCRLCEVRAKNGAPTLCAAGPGTAGALACAAALSRRCHRKSSHHFSPLHVKSEALRSIAEIRLAPKVLVEAAPRQEFEDQEVRAPELDSFSGF